MMNCFAQFYHSKYVCILFLIVIIIISPWKSEVNESRLGIGTVTALIFYLPIGLTWNYPVLRYSFSHSFELYVILVTSLINQACALINLIASEQNDMLWISVIHWISNVYMASLVYNIEGVSTTKRKKVAFVSFVVFTQAALFLMDLLNVGLESSEKFELRDVHVHIPVLDIAFSIDGIELLCSFNLVCFG